MFDKHVVITAGLRKDRADAYIPGGTGSHPLDANNVVNYSAPFTYPSSPSQSYTSDLLKTYSIVVHSPEILNRLLPWGLHESVFYNHSDNFRPVNRVGVYGQALPPPHGQTKDYGFLVSALDGKVSFKVTQYKTQVFSAELPDSNLRQTIGDETRRALQFAYDVQNHVASEGYSYRNSADSNDTTIYAYQPATGTAATWTTADWKAAEVEAQKDAKALLDNTLNQTAFLKAYSIDPATWSPTNPLINYTVPSGLTITGDTVSKGTEYELFVKPIEGWNVTMNAAQTHATRANLAGTVSQWIQGRWDLYQGPAGQLRWFGGGQGSALTSTGVARLGRNAWRWYNNFRAQEGNDVPELRPWRFNVVNTYNFSHGALKGVFVGGSYRWQDKNIIGYGVTEVTPSLSPSNPAIGKLDVTKPFYGPTDHAIDLWAGYDRKVYRNVDWRIQLNVRNAFQKTRLIPVNTNPDGSIGSWRIADGAQWELSNTFRF